MVCKLVQFVAQLNDQYRTNMWTLTICLSLCHHFNVKPDILEHIIELLLSGTKTSQYLDPTCQTLIDNFIFYNTDVHWTLFVVIMAYWPSQWLRRLWNAHRVDFVITLCRQVQRTLQQRPFVTKFYNLFNRGPILSLNMFSFTSKQGFQPWTWKTLTFQDDMIL